MCDLKSGNDRRSVAEKAQQIHVQARHQKP